LVFFPNGLPIVALEVKHEKNENVHDAVAQFVARDHTRNIFRHPFLYLAAAAGGVMAATDLDRNPPGDPMLVHIHDVICTAMRWSCQVRWTPRCH